MITSKFIIVTRRDGRLEILNKSFIKRVYFDEESKYTCIVLHDATPLVGRDLRVTQTLEQLASVLQAEEV